MNCYIKYKVGGNRGLGWGQAEQAMLMAPRDLKDVARPVILKKITGENEKRECNNVNNCFIKSNQRIAIFELPGCSC